VKRWNITFFHNDYRTVRSRANIFGRCYGCLELFIEQLRAFQCDNQSDIDFHLSINVNGYSSLFSKATQSFSRSSFTTQAEIQASDEVLSGVYSGNDMFVKLRLSQCFLGVYEDDFPRGFDVCTIFISTKRRQHFQGCLL